MVVEGKDKGEPKVGMLAEIAGRFSFYSAMLTAFDVLSMFISAPLCLSATL